MELQKEHIYSEEEYVALDHNGLLEYDSGWIIAMSPPTRVHQKVTGQIFILISNYLQGKACEAYVAPFNVRLQLPDGIKRVEPDVSVICDKSKLTDQGCEGSPDFIIEVVSATNKMHDYATKVNWYRNAGVKEYWVVNPIAKEILAYRFYLEDVVHYTFKDRVEVGIWNGDFAIDFSRIDMS